MELLKAFSPSKLRPYRRARHPFLGSSKRPFIFIHINKTGGSSVVRSIWPIHKWHDTAKDIIELIGEDKFAETFKFTVVRNPWAKVVSQYNYRIKINHQMGENPISFKEWVNKTFGEMKDPFYYDNPKWFQSQVFWLKDNQDKVSIDKIIRFENIQDEFAELQQLLGIKIKLGHRNKSKSVDFRSYYDKQTIEVINRVFEEDISLFGYAFE